MFSRISGYSANLLAGYPAISVSGTTLLISTQKNLVWLCNPYPINSDNLLYLQHLIFEYTFHPNYKPGTMIHKD